MPRNVEITVGDDVFDATEDNCEVWRFRKAPDVDYFHHWKPTGNELDGVEEYYHTIVFRQQRILVWMAGIAMEDDIPTMADMEERHDSFTKLSLGWRPPLHVTDYPTDTERGWYDEMFLNGIGGTFDE